MFPVVVGGAEAFARGERGLTFKLQSACLGGDGFGRCRKALALVIGRKCGPADGPNMKSRHAGFRGHKAYMAAASGAGRRGFFLFRVPGSGFRAWSSGFWIRRLGLDSFQTRPIFCRAETPTNAVDWVACIDEPSEFSHPERRENSV